MSCDPPRRSRRSRGREPRARSAGAGAAADPPPARRCARSKRPSWHGQRNTRSSGRGMTAHDRCVHFWLNATNSVALSRTSRQGSCAAGYAKTSAPPTVRSSTDAIRCDGQRAAVPAPPVLQADPQLAQRERGAREHHELHEVAALDVLILRPIDREVLAPGGLRLGGASIAGSVTRGRRSWSDLDRGKRIRIGQDFQWTRPGCAAARPSPR